MLRASSLLLLRPLARCRSSAPPARFSTHLIQTEELLAAATAPEEGEKKAAGPDDRKAAEMNAQAQQGLMFFTNVYPVKAFKLDFRGHLTHRNHTEMIPKLLPEDIEVLRMEPREREVRRPSLRHHCARARTSTHTVHFIYWEHM